MNTTPLSDIKEILGQDADLLAITKMRPVEDILPLLEEGHRLFGESRTIEAHEKWSNLKEQYPDIKLHLIGSLQTNKVSDAVALFDVIEVLDREKLAKHLAQEMKAQNKSLPCFIQVNTGEEPQKSGITPDDFDNFLTFCRQTCHLDITGVMCIPPIDEPVSLHFALLSSIAKKHDLPNISMGMSNDFEIALKFGATQVRVGSRLFKTTP